MIARAVCYSEHAELLAFQKFFDDHLPACIAECLATQHFFKRLDGILLGRSDDDAFACGEPVGFQDVWWLEFIQRGNGLVELGVIKACVTRRWDVVSLHECLRKFLAPFEHGPLFFGPHDQDVGLGRSLKVVGNAGDQWRFCAHHQQTDFMAPDVPLDGRKIHGIQIGSFPQRFHAAVARSNVQFPQHGRLTQLPCNGVLTPAASQQEYIHSEQN